MSALNRNLSTSSFAHLPGVICSVLLCFVSRHRWQGGRACRTALKTRPPDLTLLTQQNGGTFSASKVEEVIRGETRGGASAHGSSDMPVWAPIFRGLDSHKEVNDARIENLVKYIESIQVKVKAD